MNDEDDFGLIYLDFDEDIKETSPPLPTEPCLPRGHTFEKKLLAQHFYQECVNCGYSPDLDRDKPKFKKCHEEYMAWKKTKE